MNFLGFLWIASYIGSFFSPHSFFKAPDELFRMFSDKALAVVTNSIQHPPVNQAVSQTTRLTVHSTVNQTHFSPTASTRPWSALLNLGINLPLGNQPQRVNSPDPSATPPRSWWNVVGYAFVNPGRISPSSITATINRSQNSVIAVAQSHFQSAAQPASRIASRTASRAVARESASSDSSHKVLQVLHNLPNLTQAVRQNLWAGLPSVTVVRAGQYDGANASPGSQQGVGQCDALRPVLSASSRPIGQPVFQIRVKGHLVAEVPSQAHASQIADQIRKVLQTRDLPASAVRPALINDQPGAKAEGEVLFVVSEQLAEDISHDSELLAIEWVNNLRTALGAQALSITEARTHLLGMVETKQTFGGLASWYGPYFHGRITATGEVFNQNELTAAHRTLPFNTYLKVTNLRNGKTVIVRINDRGPYIEGRSLDLSRQAARCIQSESSGVVPYEAVVLQPAQAETPAKPSNSSEPQSVAKQP